MVVKDLKLYNACIERLASGGIVSPSVRYQCELESQGVSPEDAETQARIGYKYGVIQPTNGFFSMQNLFLMLIAVKLSKTPEGLRVLRDVAVQGIKTLGDTMEAIAKASVGNPISAWANPYLLSLLFERFGLVNSDRMPEYRIGLNLISGVEVAEDVIKALSGFRLFSIGESRHQAEEFPTTIHFGDKTYTIDPSLSMKLTTPSKKKK